MRKLLFLLCVIICGLTYVLSVNTPRKTGAGISPVKQLKKRIDSAEMKTYYDNKYDVVVYYPDFFVITDSMPGTARFRYPGDSVTTVALTMFVEPNIEEWNIEEAVYNLSDSANVCKKVGENFFIISGKFSDAPLAHYLEKCFLIDGNWIDYTLYYDAYNESAIERLYNMLLEWNPRPLLIRGR